MARIAAGALSQPPARRPCPSSSTSRQRLVSHGAGAEARPGRGCVDADGVASPAVQRTWEALASPSEWLILAPSRYASPPAPPRLGLGGVGMLPAHRAAKEGQRLHREAPRLEVHVAVTESRGLSELCSMSHVGICSTCSDVLSLRSHCVGSMVARPLRLGLLWNWKGITPAFPTEALV